MLLVRFEYFIMSFSRDRSSQQLRHRTSDRETSGQTSCRFWGFSFWASQWNLGRHSSTTQPPQWVSQAPRPAAVTRYCVHFVHFTFLPHSSDARWAPASRCAHVATWLKCSRTKAEYYCTYKGSRVDFVPDFHPLWPRTANDKQFLVLQDYPISLSCGLRCVKVNLFNLLRKRSGPTTVNVELLQYSREA